MQDNCVLCGASTPYDETVHIDNRLYYVEGVGQLCKKCGRNMLSTEIDPEPYVCLSIKTIKETPNDAELGEMVREKYFNLIKTL